jgi:hypothetical protein
VSKEFLDAIPQTDPRAGYLAHRGAMDAAIARVLDGGLYVLGRGNGIVQAMRSLRCIICSSNLLGN